MLFGHDQTCLLLITCIVDPLYVFAFLQTFINILQEYLGQISAETLKDNFDVVYQVRCSRRRLSRRKMDALLTV